MEIVEQNVPTVNKTSILVERYFSDHKLLELQKTIMKIKNVY